MNKNIKKLEAHPCGDCIYFGDKCMVNFLNCEYSDKDLYEKNLLVNRIEAEYSKWRENVLSKSNEEIYKLAYEIRFYENIFYYIENNKDEEESIKEIKEQIGNYTLKDLFQKYSDMEIPYNIENGEDIGYFLSYCK